MQETTIAAIATAPGAGGIAVVRLSGAESYRVAARVFRPANPKKSVEEAKGYTALFGHFVDREEASSYGHPTATPARTWWSFPATAAARWHAVWWKPALLPVRSLPPPASTPAAPF